LEVVVIPLNFRRRPAADIREAAAEWNQRLQTRRSVRHFSSDAIPIDAVEDIIRAAASAPSGAHKQPWTFVLVTAPSVKAKIREAAEEEERSFYGGRAGERWLKDLEAFETDWRKPFLEEAPALIAVFAQRHGEDREDRHYYVNESVGIAVGFLLAGLHHAGLATLTHTPSPMKFLAEVLGRPASERAYLLIPVGFPTDDCQVPDLERKPLDEVLVRR
jgi:iodotyrosine deiodinase